MVENPITLDIAILAKDKGFNILTKECYHMGVRRTLSFVKEKKFPYSMCIFLPTLSLLQQWLKKNYDIDVIPVIEIENENKIYEFLIYYKNLKYENNENLKFKTADEAIGYGIKKILKTI